MSLLRPCVIKQHTHGFLTPITLKYGQNAHVAVKLPFHPVDYADHPTGYYIYVRKYLLRAQSFRNSSSDIHNSIRETFVKCHKFESILHGDNHKDYETNIYIAKT